MDRLTYEEAHKLFTYRNGYLHWNERTSLSIRPGQQAGNYDGRSTRVQIRGKFYRVHRIVWLMHHGEWPEGEIDHINRQPHDNRIENLRLATRSQNASNKSSTKNSTGFKGVKKDRTGRFVAKIKKARVTHHLGTFDTAEEAHAAYCEAGRQMHGEFFCSAMEVINA